MGDVGIELMDWWWGMAGVIFKDEYAPSVWCTTRASRHSAGGACWHLEDYKKMCFKRGLESKREKNDIATEQ